VFIRGEVDAERKEVVCGGYMPVRESRMLHSSFGTILNGKESWKVNCGEQMS
jgi:hypothetical protein